jgi:ActR/RegA family two-component response regulator
MVRNALVFDPDLFFSSRIEAACRRHGLAVRVATTVDELQVQLNDSPPRVLLVNLDALNGADNIPVRSLHGSCRLIGYYSHVDSDLAKDALDRGFEVVVPRRTFMERLSGILAELGSS